MKKDMKRLFRELKAEGWEIGTTGASHAKLTHPRYGMITCSVSPKNVGHAVKSVRRDVQRRMEAVDEGEGVHAVTMMDRG